MPWIDAEMKEAIKARLRDVHGMPDMDFVDLHVYPGPKATKENLIVEIADSMARVELRRRAGEKPDGPVRSDVEPIDVRELVKKFDIPKS